MDWIRTQILGWQRAISENPAWAVLFIFIGIAVIFVAVVIIDAIFKRRNKSRWRRK